MSKTYAAIASLVGLLLVSLLFWSAVAIAAGWWRW